MTKVFVSKPNEGWKEVQIPESYKRYSHDALLSVAHQFLTSENYKGILFTENPTPF